ncbi:MAG: hypothetical protein LBD47_03055 [Treponema sp.]|jgi:hypothetical protein|nr:hypothetical protein [Treponema sp.]
MNRQHVFWGSLSPLAGLSGGALLIIASARLFFALTAAGALLWVYGVSVLLRYAGSRMFPAWGRPLIMLFIASFAGSVYLLLFWFINPLAALEAFLFISLVPLFCAGSGIFSRIESLDLADAVLRALSEAVVLGGLIIGFAILRELLGFYSSFLPGSAVGITLLFGYGAGLYRYFRSIHASREDEL